MSDSTSRLPARTVLWYGAGIAPTGILVTATTFLVFYYKQVIGLPASLVGGAGDGRRVSSARRGHAASRGESD